tara:strand:+ start:1994 stop:2494 length:501 start_codon:yes stop_codon:yes gene_type:complete
VIKKINRNYLEIFSINDLRETKELSKDYSIKLLDPTNFQLNKFFYKNIGKSHQWADRLIWTDQDWINYVSNKNVKTYILKEKSELAGYFELNLHKDEVEIAYLGLLKEYHNKKLGSILLSSAIKNSFSVGNLKRVWVHTCSLDHKHALKNYLSRGMKIFKKETISI